MKLRDSNKPLPYSLLRRRINLQIIFIYLMLIPLNVQAQQWQLINGPYQGKVNKLVMDPSATNIIFETVVSGNELYKSIDAGNTWFDIGPKMEISTNYPTVALDPLNSSIIYFGGENNGILNKTSDGGASWEKIDFLHLSGIVDVHINSIAVDPLSSNIIYIGLANAINNTIWKSTDTGETWSAKSSGMPKSYAWILSTNSIEINPHNNSVIFADVSDSGLYRSDNSGEDWMYKGFDSTIIYDIAILPWDTSFVFVASSKGLYKSKDGGTTWTQPLLNYDSRSIKIDTISKILYSGTWGNWAYKSTDFGDTWISIISPEIPASESLAMDVNNILIDSKASNNLYLGTDVGTYKSTDHGNSWTQKF